MTVLHKDYIKVNMAIGSIAFWFIHGFLSFRKLKVKVVIQKQKVNVDTNYHLSI